MSKRSVEDTGGASGVNQPPIKKVHFEPHLIGPISTLEEMDIKVLQFQNKKLAKVNCTSIPKKHQFISIFFFFNLRGLSKE